MLDFKRFCVVAWTGLDGFACNLLMQVTCNSGFLPMGAEMHFLSLPFVIYSRFICVNHSVYLRQSLFALFLFVSVGSNAIDFGACCVDAFDHSDHEMISVIRVIALGACVVYKR